MEKIITISNGRFYMPLQSTLIAYLLLDRFNASGIVWGIVGTLYVILWALWIFSLFITERIDLFKDTNVVITKK